MRWVLCHRRCYVFLSEIKTFTYLWPKLLSHLEMHSSSYTINKKTFKKMFVGIFTNYHVSNVIYKHILHPLSYLIQLSFLKSSALKSSRSFSHSWLVTGFVTRLTRRVSLVKQKLFTLLEHLSSPSVFSGVHVTRYLVFYVCFVDHCFSFFFWPLLCLFFFDIRILITLWYPLKSYSSWWYSVVLLFTNRL